jgi:hypothetical protein
MSSSNNINDIETERNNINDIETQRNNSNTNSNDSLKSILLLLDNNIKKNKWYHIKPCLFFIFSLIISLIVALVIIVLVMTVLS